LAAHGKIHRPCRLLQSVALQVLFLVMGLARLIGARLGGRITKSVTAAALVFLFGGSTATAMSDSETRALALDMFKQLVEINTTESAGNVTEAAEAMAQRLRAAGFPDRDIYIVGDDPRKKNLVVRLHGTGKARPVLLMGHLDVVEARREDWTTDPFQFIEKDGFYYGRGTSDMKDGDAIMLATLMRFRQERLRPARDIILALTADEETGDANGIAWLVKNRRDLIDAEFALNHDGQGVNTSQGRPVSVRIGVAEKIYADFELTVTNKGGHSSEPVPDNAIYELVGALGRLANYQFPFEVNPVVRTYFERLAATSSGERASDLRGILATPPDPAAIAHLNNNASDYAKTHTTCVATRLSGGHANNALPQMAKAIVNCRVLPGHEPEDVRLELIRIFAEPKLMVRYIDDSGHVLDTAASKHGFPVPVIRTDVVRAVEKEAAIFWPGAPVVLSMGGTSDAAMAAPAGFPVYAVSGEAADVDDHRQHGRDERIGVEAFSNAVDFYYRFLTILLITH
jgi:acetylornithine deacetylase/succinyl-diaminopimelate desuccinylase-like protein